MKEKRFFYMFLILLPIIDILTALSTRFNLNIISIGMVYKSLFLLIVFFKTFKTCYLNNDKLYLLIIFLEVLYILLYSYFHLINSMNIISEIVYFIKILYYPSLLLNMYVYLKNKHINIYEISKVLGLVVIEYGILLLIPIILKNGFPTYINNLSGTIGWFYSANEVSIILILLFPFIYSLFHDQAILKIIFASFLIIVISTIGTKASMLGLVIDTFLMLTIDLSKKNRIKKGVITSNLVVLILAIIVFFNSHTFYNIKVILGIQQTQSGILSIQQKELETKRIQERNLINEEIEKLDKGLNDKESIIMALYNKYGAAMLSDRDIYFKVTYKIYKKYYNLSTLLLGIGYTNNSLINTYAVEKLIEIDPLDIFFHSGIILLLITLFPFIYYIYRLIQIKKVKSTSFFYLMMLGMILSLSFISGHILMAPAVSIYIVLYFILGMNELNLINKKDYKLKKNKVTIYALHLNYGGIEQNICMKANILSEIYDVEIISLYKLNDKPSFMLNDKVKVTYLTDNIKPNKDEFKNALKRKNIIRVFKEGIYSLKVLYLKKTLLIKSMINCNSEIIISTRIDFTKKLIKNNDYNNIKIAEEHIYHNNNTRYLNDLYYILKYVDYLMPSSEYLTNYYKEIFTNYSYKIITNKMPINTNGKVSKLKNKTIISVGRLDKVKAFDDLINIFYKLDNNDWQLQIVGEGPEYNNLNELINKYNLNDRVKLLGFKSKDELNDLYELASIFVMTSYEESFGLVLLEATSHGLPILSYSSALGAKEILKNNEMLVDNRDQSLMIKRLNNLISSIELRREYQKKSLNIYKEYDYNELKKYNLNFYNNLEKSNMYMNIYKGSKKEFYNLIDEKLNKKEKQFIVTANPETFILSKKDLTINKLLYDKKNLIIPDGISIVKTANFLGYDFKERITGVDLAEQLLKTANKNNYKVYLFGSSQLVIDKLEKIINEKYNNIKLVGATNGYIKDKDAVMEYIKTTKPDIVLVALGIPLQEKLIYKHINDFKKGVFVGVGGSFDVLSGTKKRAPKFIIKCNLEWLYRIIKEPKRLGRFIKYNLSFIFMIIREKCYKNVDK